LSGQLHEEPDAFFEQWVRTVLLPQKSPRKKRSLTSVFVESAQSALDEVTGAFARTCEPSPKTVAEALWAEPLRSRRWRHSGRTAGPGRSGQRPITEEHDLSAARLKESPDRKTNFAWYKVMTAHEAGHLEFGTYDVTPNQIQHLLNDRPNRLRKKSSFHADNDFLYLPEHAPGGISLDNIEDTRVIYLLRHEYDGLVKLMDAVATTDLSRRPGLDSFKEMPPYQVLLEALVQLSFADTTEVPLDYAQAVGDAYEFLKASSSITLPPSILMRL